MANLFGAQGDREKSKHYILKAAKFPENEQGIANKVLLQLVLGNMWNAEGKTDLALAAFHKAATANNNRSKSLNVDGIRGLALTYLLKKDYRTAIFYAKQELTASLKERSSRALLDSYHVIAQSKAALGEHKDAYHFQKLYAELKDSLFQNDKIATAKELEVKYQTLQKDKDLAEKALLLSQKQSNFRSQKIWIISFSAVLLLLTGLLAFHFHSKRQKETLVWMRLKDEQEIARLKANLEGEERERQRIARELHDGIMVQLSVAQMGLSSMLTRSVPPDPASLENVLIQLESTTNELRKTAHNLLPDVLLLDGLAGAIAYFCKGIQKESGLTINYQVVGVLPTISPEYALMLYRTIQELIQNIIKHADATQALVELRCLDNLLTITVEDNGKGISVENIDDSKGIGLRHIKSRINLLNGTVNLTSEPMKGTFIIVEVETSMITYTPDYAHNNSYS